MVGKPSRIANFGFLTVVGDNDDGYVAGLLTLDARGRPVEFHCTAALRPNRAQIILYGPTLRPYLVAEQLARVLTRHVKGSLSILWTDDRDVLSIREVVDYPVGLVHCAVPPRPSEAAVATDGEQLPFEVQAAYPEDRQSIERAWQEAAHWIELSEPFGRIREAIREAHRSKVRSSA